MADRLKVQAKHAENGEVLQVELWRGNQLIFTIRPVIDHPETFFLDANYHHKFVVQFSGAGNIVLQTFPIGTLIGEAQEAKDESN